jgi:predicted HNH restriction endonuclease
MADYQPLTATLGNLIGICPDCEGMIYRRTSMVKLSAIQANLNVTFP